MRMRPLLALAAALVALPGLATAATIGGTITAQADGAPLAGAEVRVWSRGPKGWSIHMTAAANGGGGYAFTVAAGDYLVDARGPAGSGSNYGDRWYDVAAPSSGGYVGEDADVITVTAAQTVGGVDLALEILGGADGTVLRSGSVPAPSMWVRMERRAEVRIHHNDFTKTPTGLVGMRGMVPANDYQLIVYDPAGVRDTLLVPGPFTIVSNAVGALGNLVMADAPADPNEGNNTANCGAVSIDAAALHADPPQPWSSTGARIGPLSGSDVDWFCFTAVDGDRLFLTATTEFNFGGTLRRHPWTDPMVSFWRGARVAQVAANDDFGGTFDARVDTGPLTAGCHCAAVTTFGDGNFTGAGQMSTGAYQLRVTMGNRPPVPSIKKGQNEIPAAPATFSIDEGDTLQLNLSYIDADHDVPSRAFAHLDAGGNPVAGGTLNLGADTGTYTWTAPLDAAAGSPYTLRLDAGDSEFARSKTVILVVNAVDTPPPVPTLLAPIGDAVVASGAPPLTWSNVTDVDGDTVSYDLELYQDDPAGAPAQLAGAIAEGAGGTTMWTPTTIAENTRVWWRVRARTAPVGGLSPWSDYGRFLVDTANDAPPVPVLVKPSEGETVAMRRPGLSVLNVEDPEDDEVSFIFVIARDAGFTDIVWTSPEVPQNDVSATTMTSTGEDLAWGGEYWVRVRARDDRNGESDWSDPHRFRLKVNQPPGNPAFGDTCVAATLTEPAAQIVVRNVEDPEGEAVVFEVELYRYEDNPMTSFPVFNTTVPQETAGDRTTITLDLSTVPNGRYRYFIRAFDGTDASDAIECELTLDVEPPSQPGGCCSSGGGRARDAGAAALVAMLVLALSARRRRTAPRR